MAQHAEERHGGPGEERRGDWGAHLGTKWVWSGYGSSSRREQKTTAAASGARGVARRRSVRAVWRGSARRNGVGVGAVRGRGVPAACA